MRILKPISWSLPLAAILAALAILPACSVNVKDHDADGNKKVDISTPIGGIHVDQNADARDTGLPVYPGAKLKPDTNDGDKKSANVNLSAFGYGLKVVALEYQSDDPPSKIIAYYQDQLKKYGSVVQCHSNRHDNYAATFSDHDPHSSFDLKCDKDNSGKTIELKTGTQDDQRIVSVDPQGNGSDFAIVRVRMRGKEGEI
jgi:hypothetical protein